MSATSPSEIIIIFPMRIVVPAVVGPAVGAYVVT